MSKRAKTVAATRKRIIEATVAAHSELGIQATSWDEIARRADVGVGTVYRHFPSIDDLLPACGEVVTATLALPQSDDDLASVFADAHSISARIERLVATVFGLYERGAPHIWNVRRERGELPALERWHREIEGALDALAREALEPVASDARSFDVVRALTDLWTWTAFRARGFTSTEAEEAVAELILRSLPRSA